MKKSVLLVLSIVPLLFSCNDKPVEPAKNDVIDFSTVTTGFNNDSKDSFKTKMLELANKDKTILSDVSTENYVQVTQLDMFYTTEPYDAYILHALLPSSAKQNGSITFAFAASLSKIKVYAQPYFKTYHHYGSQDEPEIAVSKDDESVIKVNNETWDITQSKSQWETPDLVEKEFTINGTSLTIEGTSGKRVLIHKLELIV